MIRPRVIGLVLAATCGAGAQAAVFTVGSPSGPGQPCTHGTIQSAINAANSSAGADTIRLTRSLTYEPEANTVDTAQELAIEGGYATCGQASPDTTNTIVSGAGGAHAPVFTIHAPTGALIRLRRLTISGGDVDGGGNGGGIRFEGDGILELADSFVTQNTAGYGGGIHAKGTGSHAELVLGANVVVSNNTARYSGGGVLVQGVEMSMTDAGSSILLNKALGTGGTGGYGGGVYVYAADRPSYAYLGSGAPAFGVLYGNDALYGGGAAIASAGSDAAELQLFATDPARQAYVGFNAASMKGGGLYVANAKSAARLWNAVIDNNDAPNGAAAYMASSSGFYVNFAGMHPSATGCVVGADCGRISNNVASADADPGAIIYGESGAAIQFGNPPVTLLPDARGGAVIRENVAGSVIDGSGTTNLFRSIISDNTTSSDVIKQTGQSLNLYDATVAGNAIGGGSAILRTVNSDVGIQRAILWQPGSTSWSHSGGTLTIGNTVASENGSLGGGFAAHTFDPLFVDPAHGDYGLRAGSGAIDFAPAGSNQDRDAFGRPRNVDLPNPDNPGTRDIGALERPDVQPLVLNGDFDFSDLRLWTKFGGDWDGTNDATGGTGSGSWKYSISDTSATEVIAGEQCIVLPAPGIYRLNGWGKGGGLTNLTRDYAILKWEIREQSTGACTNGVLASGQVTLGGGTSWGHPSQPSLIDLSEAQFGTDRLSIKLLLVARDGSVVGVGPRAITAWFDGITLELASADDVLFADGFD